MIGIFFVCLLTCYDIVLVQFCVQPPPFQKNWLMAPSTTIGPETSCMREDLFWGLVWVSKVVVLVCTLVSLCPVTSVGVLFRSINSVLLLERFWGTPLLLSSTRCTEGGVSWWVRRWCFLRLC